MRQFQKIFSVIFGVVFILIAISNFSNFGAFMIPFILVPIFIIISVFKDKEGNSNYKRNGIVHKDNDFVVSGKKIEKKLSDLEYLYNRNLITKEEYEKNREKILEEIK